MPRRLLIACLIAALASAARAQDPASPPIWGAKSVNAADYLSAKVSPEAGRLVRQLSAADYETREQACRELLAKGIDAFPGLLKAIDESHDEEVVARAAQLLGPWHGELPMPAAIADGIGRYNEQRGHLLIDLRAKSTVTPLQAIVNPSELPSPAADFDLFLRVALSRETEPALKAMLSDARRAPSCFNARLALIEGRGDDASGMLRKVATTERDAMYDFAAFAALRAGPALDPQKELDGSGIFKDSLNYNQLGMLLFRAKGDLPHAVQFALKLSATSQYPARPVLIEARDFATIARQADGNRAHPFTRDRVYAHLFAGDAKVLEEIGVDAAKEVPFERDEGGLLILNGALTAAGRGEDALLAARKMSDTRAFHMLACQLRIREALATLKDRKAVPLDVVDHLIQLGLISAARDVLHAIKSDRVAGMPAVNELFFAAELERVGEPEAAAKMRARALADINSAGAKLALAEEHLAAAQRDESILQDSQPIDTEAMRRVRTEIDAATLLVVQLTMQQKSVEFAGSPAFPDAQSQHLASAWQAILERDKLSADAQYTTTLKIMKGEITDSQAAHYIKLIAEDHAGDNQFLLFARHFHALHHDDWAHELAAQWAEADGNPSCFATIGDFSLESGRPEAAFLSYLRAAPVNLADGTLMYRMGLALSRGTTDREAGRRLMDFAPWLILGDLTQQAALIDAVRHFEGPAAAERMATRLPAARLSDLDPLGRYVRARDAAVARGDYAAALAAHEQFLLCPAVSDAADFSTGMPALATLHSLRALDALARRDMPTLADALQRQLDNAPPDADLLAKTLPALRTAAPAAAGKILARAVDRLKQVVEDYPDAAHCKADLERLQALAK